MPELSVLVCTFNRSRLLDLCLACLANQEIDTDLYEVIIIDNKSTDDTSDIIARYLKENRNFKAAIERKQGLSYARNKGCEEARAEYLVYLDDDAFAPQKYLFNLMQIIKKYSPDIIGGPVFPFYLKRKPFWFNDKFETKKYLEKSGFSNSCRVTGANYVIKKSVLKKLGMFDVQLGMRGKEIGLFEERKVLENYRKVFPEREQKVYYALECFVKHCVHEDKMKFRNFLKRQYIGGKMRARMENNDGPSPSVLEFENILFRGKNLAMQKDNIMKLSTIKKKNKNIFLQITKIFFLIKDKITYKVKEYGIFNFELFTRGCGAISYYTGVLIGGIKMNLKCDVKDRR